MATEKLQVLYYIYYHFQAHTTDWCTMTFRVTQAYCLALRLGSAKKTLSLLWHCSLLTAVNLSFHDYSCVPPATLHVLNALSQRHKYFAEVAIFCLTYLAMLIVPTAEEFTSACQGS